MVLDLRDRGKAQWPGRGTHGQPAGATITVWTAAVGDLTGPPLQPSQVSGQADMAETAAIAGVCLCHLGAAAIIRNLLHRRRMAAWEADWAVTARVWNRQRW